MKIADRLLEILSTYGVQQLFGIPGDAINDITDAVRRHSSIKFIQMRHEEAGAFAPSARAKLTGRLAACVGTAGPGAIHLLNVLYDARLDHAPVIAITGQVETGEIGTQQHQEVRLEQLFADVSVYNQTIVSQDQVPAVFEEACQAAISERGVAHVSLPTNIAGGSTNRRSDRKLKVVLPAQIIPDPAACDQAVELIDAADKITIFAGIGCAAARTELIAFAEKLKAPIIRTLKAKEVIDDEHSLCIGGLGLLGGRPAVKAMDDCDLLIMVGCDFPYLDFYPKSAKTIQIDNKRTHIGKRHPVDVGVVGDARQTLTILLEHIRARRADDFLKARQSDIRSMLDQQQWLEEKTGLPISPPYVLSTISRLAPSDTIFTCDTGTVTAWAARHLHMKEQQRFILSGNLASMAFAFPGAIGAQLAFPDRKVIALAGDGAFSMLMGDFVTAVKYSLPIIAVILNNQKLGFITLEQEVKGLPDWGTDLHNLDFAAFARACGGEGYSIKRPEDLEPALKKALKAPGPIIIDVAVDPKALILPPEIKLSQAVGFSLAKLREFFSSQSL